MAAKTDAQRKFLAMIAKARPASRHLVKAAAKGKAPAGSARPKSRRG